MVDMPGNPIETQNETQSLSKKWFENIPTAPVASELLSPRPDILESFSGGANQVLTIIKQLPRRWREVLLLGGLAAACGRADFTSNPEALHDGTKPQAGEVVSHGLDEVSLVAVPVGFEKTPTPETEQATTEPTGEAVIGRRAPTVEDLMRVASGGNIPLEVDAQPYIDTVYAASAEKLNLSQEEFAGLKVEFVHNNESGDDFRWTLVLRLADGTILHNVVDYGGGWQWHDFPTRFVGGVDTEGNVTGIQLAGEYRKIEGTNVDAGLVWVGNFPQVARGIVEVEGGRAFSEYLDYGLLGTEEDNAHWPKVVGIEGSEVDEFEQQWREDMERVRANIETFMNMPEEELLAAIKAYGFQSHLANAAGGDIDDITIYDSREDPLVSQNEYVDRPDVMLGLIDIHKSENRFRVYYDGIALGALQVRSSESEDPSVYGIAFFGVVYPNGERAVVVKNLGRGDDEQDVEQYGNPSSPGGMSVVEVSSKNKDNRVYETGQIASEKVSLPEAVNIFNANVGKPTAYTTWIFNKSTETPIEADVLFYKLAYDPETFASHFARIEQDLAYLKGEIPFEDIVMDEYEAFLNSSSMSLEEIVKLASYATVIFVEEDEIVIEIDPTNFEIGSDLQ